jgi:hypothetical protein
MGAPEKSGAFSSLSWPSSTLPFAVVLAIAGRSNRRSRGPLLHGHHAHARLSAFPVRRSAAGIYLYGERGAASTLPRALPSTFWATAITDEGHQESGDADASQPLWQPAGRGIPGASGLTFADTVFFTNSGSRQSNARSRRRAAIIMRTAIRTSDLITFSNAFTAGRWPRSARPTSRK